MKAMQEETNCNVLFFHTLGRSTAMFSFSSRILIIIVVVQFLCICIFINCMLMYCWLFQSSGIKQAVFILFYLYY